MSGNFARLSWASGGVQKVSAKKGLCSCFGPYLTMITLKRTPLKSGKRREHKLKICVGTQADGVGVCVKGLGPKMLGMSLQTQGEQTFGGMAWHFLGLSGNLGGASKA